MTTPVYPLGQRPEPAPVPPTFQPQPPVPLPVYEQSATPPQLADQENAASKSPAGVKIPEGGYAQRFVDIPLPELNLPGVECWVRMRNPGLMSQGAFEEIMAAIKGVKADEDGDDDADVAEQLPLMQAQFLKLIAAWSVWDAESAEDTPPMLPSPPSSVDDIKRAPMLVMKAMMSAFQELQDPQ